QANQLLTHVQTTSSYQHHGVSGGARELPLRSFLADHLPKKFRVGTGCIASATLNPALQHDIVIADNASCLTLLATGETSLFPIEAVHGVVSVKSGPDLDIETQLHSFAQLRTLNPPEGAFGGPPSVPAHGRTAPAVHGVFALRGPTSRESLLASLAHMNDS